MCWHKIVIAFFNMHNCLWLQKVTKRTCKLPTATIYKWKQLLSQNMSCTRFFKVWFIAIILICIYFAQKKKKIGRNKCRQELVNTQYIYLYIFLIFNTIEEEKIINYFACIYLSIHSNRNVLHILIWISSHSQNCCPRMRTAQYAKYCRNWLTLPAFIDKFSQIKFHSLEYFFVKITFL
jgi:hypothetical protein